VTTVKRWVVADPIPDDVSHRLTQAGYPALVAQLLHNRGVGEPEAARRFLEGELEGSDAPELLLGMEAALDRLHFALARGERIVVYGDYDSDGVTATALTVQVLRALGADVERYIPDREEEGYGLNAEALRTIQGQQGRVVITVDCGVRANVEAEVAHELGLDLIVTDHHEPGPELPQHCIIINPKQAGDTYPEKDLAGVGLAYKLAQGLVRPLGRQSPITGSDVLDLVALGTVADMAPLTGENRRLVRLGLGVLNRPRREGIKALLSVAGVKPGQVDAGRIGFALGPRLNAAGRLESALAAYELLSTTDGAVALDLAWQLEAQNRERQDLTRAAHSKAREIALSNGGHGALLFAAHADFREGVVGLAAARLMDEFYRPAIVAHCGPQRTKGSARSIPEFHITQALDDVRPLLEKHGGHKAAAGFTVLNENLDELSHQLQQIAEAQLGDKELRPTQRIDADQVPLASLTFELYDWLRQFEPCGFKNPTPVLASRGLKVVNSRTVGSDGRHLKLTVTDGRGMFDAIAFGLAPANTPVPPSVDLAYCLEVNEWQGSRRLQLNVKSMQPGS
jgi:single-stranded-DNA-specific exonuclease